MGEEVPSPFDSCQLDFDHFLTSRTPKIVPIRVFILILPADKLYCQHLDQRAVLLPVFDQFGPLFGQQRGLWPVIRPAAVPAAARPILD